MTTDNESVTKIFSYFGSRVERKIWEKYETGELPENEFHSMIAELRAMESHFEKFLNLLNDSPASVQPIKKKLKKY